MSALACALALGLTLNNAEAQVGSKAGVAAAVRGPVQQISYRTPDANIGRNVGSGDEVFLGDRIVTGAAGGLQVMLLDGTTFTLGPNTSMVIDEFVYNPADGSGKITASVVRGSLRVVSGRIARQEQEAVRVKLPVATVGIRGTMAVFTGGPNGFFIGLIGVGPNNTADRPQSILYVYGQGGEGTGIFRTGWGCAITPASPTCNPQPITPELLQQLLGQIGGQVRYVTLIDFEKETGLNFAQALQFATTQFGNERFWDLFSRLFQDDLHPGDPTTTPHTTVVDCSGGHHHHHHHSHHRYHHDYGHHYGHYRHHHHHHYRHGGDTADAGDAKATDAKRVAGTPGKAADPKRQLAFAGGTSEGGDEGGSGCDTR